MTASYIQVYPDAGGKKVRSRSRTIGSDEVHEQFMITLPSDRVVTTRYWFTTGALVVNASADASNVGRVYIENDEGSAYLIAVTQFILMSQIGSVLLTPTSPRIGLKRFTFTGATPSGSAITGSKQDSTLPTKGTDWDVRTAATGMTITEVADVAAWLPMANQTAVGVSNPSYGEWRPDPDKPLILRAGEGLMLKQLDAGTTSDTRRFTGYFEVEEFTIP